MASRTTSINTRAGTVSRTRGWLSARHGRPGFAYLASLWTLTHVNTSRTFSAAAPTRYSRTSAGCRSLCRRSTVTSRVDMRKGFDHVEMACLLGDASLCKSAGPRTGEYQAGHHAAAPAAAGPGLADWGSTVPRTRG